MARPNVFASIEVKKLESKRFRPAPPLELSVEEAAEWNELLSQLKGDFIRREMYPLMVLLCQNVIQSRQLSNLLHQYTSEMLKDSDHLDFYCRLSNQKQNCDKTILSAATKLRLTPQSRYAPDTAVRKTEAR